MKKYLPLSAAAVCLPAWCAEGVSGPAWGVIQMILGLALVLGLIVLASWALRRLGAGTASSCSPIKVLTAASVGPRERVVLVEINDTWLVLGVAPGRVATLHQLPRQIMPVAQDPPRGFAGWLAEARGKQDATS